MADPGIRIYETSLEISGAQTMAHVMTQIRQFAVSQLSGLPTTGSNVFESRPDGDDWPIDQLPGINVETDLDVLNREIANTREKEVRQVSLIVEIRAVGTDPGTVAATVDQSAAEVTGAILADETLGGLAKETFLSEIKTETAGELAKLARISRLTFSVNYRIRPSDPETSIP